MFLLGPPPTDPELAYHEAGHFIVGRALGAEYAYVTLDGSQTPSVAPTARGPHCLWLSGTFTAFVKQALAGIVGQSIGTSGNGFSVPTWVAGNPYGWRGGQSDVAKVQARLAKDIPGESKDQFWDQMRTWVQELFADFQRRYANALHALADVLIKKRTLTQAEADVIVAANP